MTRPEGEDDITLPLPVVRWWEPDETTSWRDVVVLILLNSLPFVIKWLVS